MKEPRERWVCSPDSSNLGIDNRGVVWHREPHDSVHESYEVIHYIEKSAYDDLKKRADALAEALNLLKNETRGTLYAHEIAIRYDHGNSNWTCLEMALDKADEALAACRTEGEGE